MASLETISMSRTMGITPYARQVVSISKKWRCENMRTNVRSYCNNKNLAYIYNQQEGITFYIVNVFSVFPPSGLTCRPIGYTVWGQGRPTEPHTTVFPQQRSVSRFLIIWCGCCLPNSEHAHTQVKSLYSTYKFD